MNGDRVADIDPYWEVRHLANSRQGKRLIRKRVRLQGKREATRERP